MRSQSTYPGAQTQYGRDHDMSQGIPNVIAIEVSDEDLEFQPGELTEILLDAIQCRIGYALQVDKDMSVLPKLLVVAKFLSDQKATDPGNIPDEGDDPIGQMANRTRA